MSGITSGVGLISGINTAELIDQLLSIESRPQQLVQRRNTVLTTEQIAFQDISAKLLVMKLSAGSFSTNDIFNSTTSSSSDDSVLTVSSTTGTVPGTYNFTVDRLVSTQQVITGGFADQSVTPIASSGGTLTFEFGDARLDANTDLSILNGGAGISRGKILVTDRSGSSSVIDLSKALKVDDVLNAINNASGVNVIASVEGDTFKLVDGSGGGGTLLVSDIGVSGTTASLGLNAAAVGNTLTGLQVNLLGQDTVLNSLNDGNGIRIRAGVEDFQVTRRDGTTFNVNLDNATDISGVISAINTASGGNVTVSVDSSGAGLQLVDSTGSTTTNLQVAALNSSNAASDLGLIGSVASNTLTGTRVIAGLNSKLVSSLNGGSGVTTPGTIDVTNRAGTLTTIDLSSARSVAEMISVINNAGAGVSASLNSVGNGLLLTDTTGSTVSNLIVADNTGTTAADLNLVGSVAAKTIDSGNLQLRYISEATLLGSLNGGGGVSSGRFVITDSSGDSATVDLTQGERTIQEVLSEINSRGLDINARINDNGDGILIEDTGPGTTSLRIEEAGSTTARDLGILGEATTPGDDINGSFEKTVSLASVLNLVGTTKLTALNGGDGVDIESGQDDFSITTRAGTTYNVNLDGLTDMDDVINAISTASSGNVTAAINGSQTGLTLTDSTTGASTFQVLALNSSNAASDLGILRSDADDGTDGVISGGSIIEITTLDSLVSQINSAGIGITATVINDGSAANPFRLSLQSKVSGQAGAFLFEDGGLGFDATTLVQAQDAVVFFGSSDPAKAIAITSTTNTLNAVVPGATIDLKSTSATPVQVTVSRDNSAMIDAAKSFVDSFNTVMSTIRNLDSFNPETEERGLLLGDPTLASIRSTLFRLVNSTNSDLTSQFKTLAQVGITVRGGARLSFDSSKFTDALQADFNAVVNLFTFKETETDPVTNEISTTAAGTLVKIDELLENLTNSQSGLIQNRINGIASQIDLNNARIAQFDILLGNKRQRLEAQFLAMEIALAGLQSQNSALAGLQSAIQFANQRNSNN